jgi:hypothetical protein
VLQGDLSCDFTGIPIQTVQRIPSRQDQISQEIRYASDADQRLRQSVAFSISRSLSAEIPPVFTVRRLRTGCSIRPLSTCRFRAICLMVTGRRAAHSLT